MKDKKQRAGASGWTMERRLAKAKQMREYNQSRTQTERSTIPKAEPRPSVAEHKAEPRPSVAEPRPSVAQTKRNRSNWTREDTLDACFTPLVRSFIYGSDIEWRKRKEELLKQMS